MRQDLFRYEPYWQKWFFSYHLELYTLEDEPFGESAYKVFKSTHPNNGLSAPVKVQIQITNRCNFECPHCYVSSGMPLLNEMTLEQIQSLLLKLKEWGVLQITWSGGEAFSRKNFIEIAQYAYDLGFENSVLTNGYAIGKVAALYPPDLWKLFERIQISIDGWDESFNKWVGLPNAWFFVEKAIKELYESKPDNKRLIVTSTISEELDSWGKIAYSIHDKDITWRIAKQVKNGRSSVVLNEIENHTSLSFIEIEKLRSIYKIKVVHPYDKTIYQEGLFPKEWNVEPGGRWYFYIKANGDVYPFPYLDGLEEFKAGNVLNDSLEDIWVSMPLNKYREVNYNNSGCKDCSYVCNMWTRSFNIFNDGNLFATPPVHFGCPRI